MPEYCDRFADPSGGFKSIKMPAYASPTIDRRPRSSEKWTRRTWSPATPGFGTVSYHTEERPRNLLSLKICQSTPVFAFGQTLLKLAKDEGTVTRGGPGGEAASGGLR